MIEALTVIGVIALIGGAVLSMLTQASHTYAATVMNGVAQREASSITDLIRDLVRMSVEITTNREDEIKFQLVPWDTTENAAKLQPTNDTDYGPEVWIHLADSHGSQGTTGTNLWLAVKQKGASGYGRKTLLSSRIEDFELAYFYAENTTDSGPVYFQIPAGTSQRDMRRRINAVRVRITAFGSDATDPSLGGAASYSRFTTSTVVYLRNAKYMPGAYQLLDPNNSDADERPRTYLVDHGLGQSLGLIPLSP